MTSTLLSPKQAAEMLNVSNQTIYRMVRENELPGIRIRKSIKIKLEDVEKYLQTASS